MAAPQRVRGDSAGTGFAQPAGLRGSAQKRKGPLERSAHGAASHGRPVSTGRDGDLWPLSASALTWAWPPLGGSERSDGVPAGHWRERLRIKTKRPPAVLAGGLENPAATYSPGSEDQVPSAMRGLTSVFGMGTGVTLARLPLKQSLHENLTLTAIAIVPEARRVRAAHAGQLNQIVERKEKRLTGY